MRRVGSAHYRAFARIGQQPLVVGIPHPTVGVEVSFWARPIARESRPGRGLVRFSEVPEKGRVRRKNSWGLKRTGWPRAVARPGPPGPFLVYSRS